MLVRILIGFADSCVPIREKNEDLNTSRTTALSYNPLFRKEIKKKKKIDKNCSYYQLAILF